MEPEGSLRHSQVPATSPYPVTALSSSPPPTSHFQKIHLRLGLLGCLFPSDFPTKTLYTPLISLIRATWPACLILLDFITRTILGEEYRSLSSSLYIFLYNLVTSSLLGPNILLNTILKHPQPTFLPPCERPSFTPIQNNRKNCSSVYRNLHIFG